MFLYSTENYFRQTVPTLNKSLRVCIRFHLPQPSVQNLILLSFKLRHWSLQRTWTRLYFFTMEWLTQACLTSLTHSLQSRGNAYCTKNSLLKSASSENNYSYYNQEDNYQHTLKSCLWVSFDLSLAGICSRRESMFAWSNAFFFFSSLWKRHVFWCCSKCYYCSWTSQ